jgi:hypothetical protein
MGLAARNIRRKNLKDPVLRAVASDPNGNQYKCNSQDTMVPAMGTSNSDRQQQCTQTLFQMAPLLDIMDNIYAHFYEHARHFLTINRNRPNTLED